MAKLIRTLRNLTNTDKILTSSSKRLYVLTGKILGFDKRIINLTNDSRVSPLALTNLLLASTFPSRIRMKDLQLTETTARALIGRSLLVNTTSTTRNTAASTTADQVLFR